MTASLEAKPWLKSYPPGVPAELSPLEFQSIPQMLEASVQRYREQPAFQSFGVQITYAELDRLTRDFAAYLQTSLGLRKGERVAVMMPNILQYPIAVYGILRAGLVVVSVNPLYTARELEHQLKDSRRGWDRDFRDRGAHPAGGHRAHAGQACDRRVGRRSAGLDQRQPAQLRVPPDQEDGQALEHCGRSAVPAGPGRGRGCPMTTPVLAAEDLAFLQYTGGTTGVSKGAMLQHRRSCPTSSRSLPTPGTSCARAGKIAVAPLPFYHILALVLNCMMFVRGGGLQILIANPRDIPSLVKTLAASRFTFFVGVNTLFNALVHNEAFRQSGLQQPAHGGRAAERRCSWRWPSAGKRSPGGCCPRATG